MSSVKLDILPKIQQKYAHNRLADYIELRCIYSPDREISLNDIMQIYNNEEEFFEVPDSDETPSEEMSRQHLQFSRIFAYIKSRSQFLGGFYPFEYVDKDTIKLSDLTSDNLLYIYLLISSNTGYLDKSLASKFTSSFEKFSSMIMGFLYPNFINKLFGTSNVSGSCFHGGSLYDRLIKLSKCLNTDITKEEKDNPRNNESSGDKGIDLVAFYKFDFTSCEATHIPFTVGQCSCSYDEWDTKQVTVSNLKLRDIFEKIAICHEYMFIPFSLRGTNGKWTNEDASDIRTIVVDRFRFFSIMKINNVQSKSVITEDINTCLENVLEELYVPKQ